jgi:hypothetical protein
LAKLQSTFMFPIEAQSHAKRWITPALIVLILLASISALAADAPAPDTQPAFSPFGIGGDSQTQKDLTRWIPQMADIGIHRMRYSTLKQMDYLAEHHIVFDALLNGVPPGDKIDAHGTLPVKNLEAWAAFVAQHVHEANGRVKYWEVWNEPPNGIGRGQTPADYARIVVSTYDTAHGIDPTCSVGLAAKSVHVTWLERTIVAGAKGHFDYVVLHPYETLGTAVDHAGAEPVFLNIVPTVRKMLAARDPEKVNVPIVFTELGCDTNKGVEHQAYALVKAYAMGIEQGVACIEWFEGMDGDSGPMGLLQANGTPRPAYTAMAQMIRHLGQHPTSLGWVLLHDRNWGFVFDGAQGAVLITWAPAGVTGADTQDFGRPVQIVDPLTGKIVKANTCALTSAPVLILDVPENLVNQAKANKGKPLPWAVGRVPGPRRDRLRRFGPVGQRSRRECIHGRSQFPLLQMSADRDQRCHAAQRSQRQRRVQAQL